MLATVLSVRVEVGGSVLASDLTAGDAVVEVETAADFENPTGVCVIAGQELAYTSVLYKDDPDDGVTVDTLVLAAVSPLSAPQRVTRVDVPDAEEFIAQVRLDGSKAGTDATVVPHLAKDRAFGLTGPWGARVKVERDDDQLWVTKVVGRRPKTLLSFADPDDPVTPGALTEAFDQFPTSFDGKYPASGLGQGRASAPIEFTNLVAGGLTGTSTGIQFTDPQGGVGFSATPDGTRFGGQVGDFETVRVTSRAEVVGLDIPAGGDLTLGAQVAPPGVPPNGTQDWPQQAVDLANTVPLRRHSLAVQDLTHGYCLATNRDGRTLVEKFNPTTGAATGTTGFKGAPTVTTILSLGYSTAAGLLVTLEYDAAADAYLVRYYSTGSATYDHGWTATQLGAGAARRPALAVHSFGGVEFVMLARSRADGRVDMHRFDAEAFVISQTSTDAFGFGDLESCTFQGLVVYLTGMMHITTSAPYPGQPVMPVVNFTTGIFGSPGPTLGYLPVAYGDTAGSLTTWDGDTFNRTFYLSRMSNVLYQHGDPFRDDDQAIAVTGYDTATGHETGPSMLGFFKKTPGTRITFTLGPPGSPAYDAYRFYLGAAPGGVDPGAANMWLQDTTAAGVYTLPIFDVKVSGTNLAASRTAPTAPTPGALRAADGTVLIDGNHTGEIYTLIAAGGGGGGGSSHGISIFCGDASGATVSINCGGA